MRKSVQIAFWMIALFSPGFAYANAGLPMLFLAMPAFLISLIPIIAIEGGYLSYGLGLPLSQSMKTSAVANAVSTIVGVPLTWGLLVLVQIMTGGGGAYGIDSFLGKVLAVTWQAPWLIPYEDAFDWMIPAAGLVLLVPFFFASWWSEYLVARKLNKGFLPAIVRVKIRNANLITYSLLAAWPVGFWILGSVIK